VKSRPVSSVRIVEPDCGGAEASSPQATRVSVRARATIVRRVTDFMRDL